VTGKGIAFLAVANIGGGEGVGDNGNGDTACWKLIEHLRDRYLSS
jgi:hypothetical protein